jgi:ADP-heptose:LPS heptosyltransferase
MDLVISVDTAIAHLAGGLNKPLYLLLPFNADYRWMLDRSDTPWYQVAKLFRQAELGKWDEGISDLKNYL